MAEISARKRIWGWMMFDWATQPFYTLGLTFVFAPFFAETATGYYLGTGLGEEAAKARAQTVWANMLAIVGVFIAFTAPVIGSIADTRGRRMPWITSFSVVYVIATFSLWWMVPDGSWIIQALFAFGIAMIAAEYMLVMVNAMLPALATKDELGNLSGAGFALGYAGGVVSLILMLLLFAEDAGGRTLLGGAPILGLDGAAREGTRSMGPMIAIWFAIFMVPFFMWVRDARQAKVSGVGRPIADLAAALRRMVRWPSLFAYLGSSMFYRDALNAIYGFGGTYALLVLDWDIIRIGVFGILAAVSAAILTWLGGRVDRRVGPKPVIVFNVWVMIFVSLVFVNMSRESFFGAPISDDVVASLPLLGALTLVDVVMLGLGVVIGGAGGALQGASRTLMARHADPARPTEAFGLYAFSGKATAFLAPALIGIATAMTESARLGLAPVIGLFIVALVLLRWVDPEG